MAVSFKTINTDSFELERIQDNVQQALNTLAVQMTSSLAASASSSSSTSSGSAVGDLRQSLLTETQFQSQMGTKWVLADGRSVVGSTYASLTGSSTIPDLRGMVLRGKNNGRADGNQNPDGELAIGAFQADSFASHSHAIGNTNTVIGAGAVLGSNSGSQNDYTSNVTKFSGGNETRMKNVTVNHFIRIN